jgi:hypothetical protein
MPLCTNILLSGLLKLINFVNHIATPTVTKFMNEASSEDFLAARVLQDEVCFIGKPLSSLL